MSTGIRVADVVKLNTGDKLRMSVRKIDGDEAVCQWVAGDAIRKGTFHVDQLTRDLDQTSPADLGAYILQGMLEVGVLGHADAIDAAPIEQLRELEDFATALRQAAVEAIARKSS